MSRPSIVTVDFETFYDRQFSLSKMTTEAYIRDPQFEVIGVAVKVDRHPADWFSGTHDEVRQWLHAIDWADKFVLAHNAMFDAAILDWHFGIRPKMWLDTLSMARPAFGTTTGCSLKALAEAFDIGAKGTEVLTAIGKRRADFTPQELAQYGEYCKNDVELCRTLFDRMMPTLPKAELFLVDQTVRMFTQPVLELDPELLSTHLSSVRAGKAESLKTALRTAYAESQDVAAAITAARLKGKTIKDMLMSNDMFAALLRTTGIEPPTKVSLKTGKQAWAFAKTDEEFTDLLDHPDPAVQALVAARLDTKTTIEETRTERFLAMAERGAMPIPLSYSGAFQTWRWSGSDKMNMQNLPRGGILRKALRAPAGHKIVACDSSNIELRVNHTLAGQASSVASFREGLDLYCEFASILFGRIITKADKAERQLGKLCVAEGELVLTDRGLVPIEQVTALHRLWDGVEWVSHGGTVFVGEKEVLCYDGVTATPDHVVYLRNGVPCELSAAAATRSHLAATGASGQAVRVGEDFDERAAARGARGEGVLRVPRLPRADLDQPVEPRRRKNTGVPAVQPAAADPSVAHHAGKRYAPALREPQRPGIQKLWWARDQVRVPVGVGGGALDSRELGAAQGHGARPDRQRAGVRSGEHSLGYARSEYEQPPRGSYSVGARNSHQAPGSAVRGQHAANPVHEVQAVRAGSGSPLGAPLLQTKRRVWDILDAGPRHRFTVSGKLVSNCHLSLGYGCGWAKFQHICRMNKVPLSDEEAQRVVKLWRDTYARIPAMWRSADKGLAAIANGTEHSIGPTGLVRTTPTGLATPPGHFIRYAGLTQTQDGWTYTNRRQQKKIYGASMVENICQHLARNIIADQWVKAALWCSRNAPGWRVILQVHDEIVLCGPERDAPRVSDAVLKIMSASPDWWPDVPLAAESGIGDTYGAAH